MNNNIRYKQAKLYCFLLTAVIFLLSGCSQDDEVVLQDENSVVVPIEIGSTEISQTKAIENQPFTTNRVLILPFKKINESIVANDDSNFAPDYNAARQYDINNTTAYTGMLNLTATSTYKVIVIGYNRNDYDFNNQSSPANRFNIGAVTTPVTLANFHLQSTSVTSVPEFFTGVCMSYAGATATPNSPYFRPDQVTSLNLKATLTRLVSGLNLQINNIPAYVTSVTLVAQQLVKAVLPITGTGTVFQLAADADNLKTFGVKSPVAGSVAFNYYLLPTFSAHSTKFYLDVKYATYTERYTVNVPDLTNISSASNITFTPNEVVTIVGNYSNINFGFTINNSINLDDNAWDGLH